jgi:predicted lipoprotein with Yx(FWY)xxD motif
VLVDDHGRTLYTFTSGDRAVPCTGPCGTVWPPFLVPTGSTPKGVAGVTGLGTTAQGQVTEDSLPLYRYAGDSAAGDATGDGINSFGGVWHVVTVGTSISGGASSTTTAPSST